MSETTATPNPTRSPFARQRALKPAGYSAVAEALVKPMIFIGSTLLVTIACYALAKTQLIAVISGQPTAQDVLVLILVGGLGVLMDTVINIAASRFRMHMARGKRDRGWAIINGMVLTITLGAEGMTLLYFGYLIDPADTPAIVAQIIPSIHDALYFLRYPAIPLLLFYLIAGVLPLTIEAADRDRQTKASTSVNIAGLQEDLVRIAVGPEATVEDKIRALADQHAINEHASHAGPDEIRRNAILINKLCAQNGLPPMVQLDGMPTPPVTITPAEPAAPLALPEASPAPPTNGHHVPEIAAAEVEALPEEEPETVTPAMQNEVAATIARPKNPSKPRPSSRAYRQMVYDKARELLSQDQALTLFALAQALHERVEDVETAINVLKNQRVNRLVPPQEATPDPVLDTI